MYAFKEKKEKSSDNLEESFNNSCRNLFSIICDEKIVGMIGVCIESDRHCIYGFCIDPEYQGRGIGKYSLTHIVDKCRKGNLSRFNLINRNGFYNYFFFFFLLFSISS